MIITSTNKAEGGYLFALVNVKVIDGRVVRAGVSVI